MSRFGLVRDAASEVVAAAVRSPRSSGDRLLLYTCKAAISLDKIKRKYAMLREENVKLWLKRQWIDLRILNKK